MPLWLTWELQRSVDPWGGTSNEKTPAIKMRAKNKLRKITLRGAELGRKKTWFRGKVHNSYRTLHVEGDIPLSIFPRKMSWNQICFGGILALGLALVLAQVGIFVFHRGLALIEWFNALTELLRNISKPLKPLTQPRIGKHMQGNSSREQQK